MGFRRQGYLVLLRMELINGTEMVVRMKKYALR